MVKEKSQTNPKSLDNSTLNATHESRGKMIKSYILSDRDEAVPAKIFPLKTG
jgi:hypothetical protein